MRTTSSDPGSVPTNLACVTASAIFSIAAGAVSQEESEEEKQFECTVYTHCLSVPYILKYKLLFGE